MTDEENRVELPSRQPAPAMPRRRTWIDNDGDLWWHVKGEENLVGFQEGKLIKLSFEEIEAAYGPLTEMASINEATAADQLADVVIARFTHLIRAMAKGIEINSAYDQPTREAIVKTLMDLAQDLADFKR